MKRRVHQTTEVIAAGITLAAASLLLAAPRGLAFAQAPAGAAASPTATGSYIVGGSPTDVELDKLLAAIRKLDGVEQAEVQKIPGVTLLRVRAAAQGTLIITAARAAGFEVRQTPTRIYMATGPSQDSDVSHLRTTLRSLPGVEQLEMTRQPSGIALRVRGAIDPAAMAAAVKPAGFEVQIVSGFVAAGPAAAADVERLHTALSRLPGVAKIDIRTVLGGANLVVYGDVKDGALSAAARACGYGLLPVSDPAGETQQFTVQGVTGPAEEAKLRDALRGAGVPGEIRIQTTPEGVRLSVPTGAAPARMLTGAAKSAGFDLTPVETVNIPSVGSERERITPPAPNERTIEEQTRIGEPAPDFTLLTHDGKGKITLSNSFGKRPVVLIFGSYT
jgi:copper chaperone CopZ